MSNAAAVQSDCANNDNDSANECGSSSSDGNSSGYSGCDGYNKPVLRRRTCVDCQ